MISHRGISFCVVVSTFACLICACDTPACSAEKYELSETANDKRVFSVQVSMQVIGTLQTPLADGKAAALDLKSAAKLGYQERRLASLGKDSTDFRGLRVYSQAEVISQVSDRKTQTQLRPALRQIVVDGQPDGIRPYSLAGPLTYEELELLRAPVDSLTVLSLLPQDRVEIGEKWTAPRWAFQFLTAIEAVEKGELNCRLESVDNEVAKVAFEGDIAGGILGAPSQLKLAGFYLYDLKQQCLTKVEISQGETRGVGSVTPGLKVTAKATLERTPSESTAGFSDEVVDKLPREPDRGAFLLMMQPGDWGIRVYHDRLWHLFHHTGNVGVLRFVERGSLIAQCNISPIGNAPAGKHVSEAQFQKDVQAAIGPSFREIVKAEVVPTKDNRYILRVISAGEANQKTSMGVRKVPVNWIYYLIANSDGRQIVLVFTIEQALRERFDDRDINLAIGVDFIPKSPTK